MCAPDASPCCVLGRFLGGVSQNESMSTATPTATYLDRIDRPGARMHEADIDVLLVSVGRDLPYLTGYEAMPLERLTMLVVPRDGEATLVVPRLEAPRVVEQPGGVHSCCHGTRPTTRSRSSPASSAGPPTAAVGDTMWARFLVELLGHWPSIDDAVRALDRSDECAADAQGRRRDRRPCRGRRGRRPDRRRPAGRATSRWPVAPRPKSAPTSARGSSPRVTRRSTSPSSPPARTQRHRTITPVTG